MRLMKSGAASHQRQDRRGDSDFQDATPGHRDVLIAHAGYLRLVDAYIRAAVVVGLNHFAPITARA